MSDAPWRRFPRHVGGRHFGIVLGLEFEAFALEVLAQAIVVRQRAIVDEAEIGAGGEGMRAGRGHRTLGRHARVADDVRALGLVELELVIDGFRQADFLEDFDRLAGADDAHLRDDAPSASRRPALPWQLVTSMQ